MIFVIMGRYVLAEGELVPFDITWPDDWFTRYTLGEEPARFPLPVTEFDNCLAMSYQMVMPFVKHWLLNDDYRKQKLRLS